MHYHITITPRPLKTDDAGKASSHQRYAAYLDDCHLCDSRTPFFEAARVLIRRGASPTDTLTMSYTGSDMICLKAPLGVAAKHTIVENADEGPRLARYRPMPSEVPFAAVREGGKTAMESLGLQAEPPEEIAKKYPLRAA